MSSKNARKKDAADKYLERKIKALDATERHMRAVVDGYKADRWEALDKSYHLNSENIMLKHKIDNLGEMLKQRDDLINKMCDMDDDEVKTFIVNFNAKAQRDEKLQKSIHGLTAFTDIIGRF